MLLGPSIPRQAQPENPKSFHAQKCAGFEILKNKVPLEPTELKAFVNAYVAGYETTFKATKPNTYERIDLFKKVSEHYCKLYQSKFKSLKTNDKATIEDLTAELTEFVENFPEGENALIHYAGNQTFALLTDELLQALNKKVINTNETGIYHFFAKYPKFHKACIEPILLQKLAKLPIAMQQKPSIHANFSSDYKGIIIELIHRSTRYFANSSFHQNPAISYTLAALPQLDITAFETPASNRGVRQSMTTNKPIDEVVAVCLHKLLANPSVLQPAYIIRIMHSVIVLSNQKHKFKNYISDHQAKQLLTAIKDHLKLDISNETDSFLAKQLFQIKNVFPDVFPRELNPMIAPFVKKFKSSSCRSHFENQVYETVLSAINELKSIYGEHLIDDKKLNPSNPISETLGLEADLSYETEALKVCIQVDGKKYHQYFGAGRANQKTQLRDHCFKNNQWSVIHFSDSNKDSKLAKEQLMEKIVIPTYELLTRKNISIIKGSHNRLNSVKGNETINKKCAALKEKVQQFDFDKAEKLANISNMITRLRTEINALEAANVGQQLSTLTDKINQAQSKIVKLSIDLMELTRISEAKHKQIEEIQNTLNNQRTRANIDLKEQYQEEYNKLEVDIRFIEKEQSKLNMKLSMLKDKAAPLKAKNEALERSKRELAACELSLKSPIIGTDLIRDIEALEQEAAKVQPVEVEDTENQYPECDEGYIGYYEAQFNQQEYAAVGSYDPSGLFILHQGQMLLPSYGNHMIYYPAFYSAPPQLSEQCAQSSQLKR